MNHNIISQKELKELLRQAYFSGMSDKSETDKVWDRIEPFHEFIERRCEKRIAFIVEDTGKYRIK